MENLNGCQMPCLPKISEGKAKFEPQPFSKKFKRMLAKPWNYYGKKLLKSLFAVSNRANNKTSQKVDGTTFDTHLQMAESLKPGEWVRVRSVEEIQATLNPFKELKGCAFLEDMKQYCGTEQRVFKVMERFLDERDYKVKKTRGIVLLEGVYCQGTPVFGRCDRSCLLFWREEWLEKVERAQ